MVTKLFLWHIVESPVDSWASFTSPAYKSDCFPLYKRAETLISVRVATVSTLKSVSLDILG